MLDTGKISKAGPPSTLTTAAYYSIAQEILKAEADPKETTVSAPWYTVIPTELVRLKETSDLPRYATDKNGVWEDTTDIKTSQSSHKE